MREKLFVCLIKYLPSKEYQTPDHVNPPCLFVFPAARAKTKRRAAATSVPSDTKTHNRYHVYVP